VPGLPQQRFQQLAAWFEGAVRIPPGTARSAYLAEIANGDETLRQDLERLLESDSRYRTALRAFCRDCLDLARTRRGTCWERAEWARCIWRRVKTASCAIGWR